MKKKLSLIVLLITTFTFAQKEDKYGSFDEIKLTLKDGSVIEGFGRININEEIIYKENKEAEKKIFNYKNVHKIIIKIGSTIKRFEYITIEGIDGINSVKLVQKIITGKLNLYEDYTNGVSYSPTMNGSYDFSNYSKTTYYISKNENVPATDLRIGNTYSERFNEIAQKIFSDCPDILNKIDNKYFKRYGISEVVKYYNQTCK